MAYLEGEEPSIEDLKRCIRTGTLNGAFTPILTGTAFKNKGVQPLLDAVIDYMPAPTDVEAIKGTSVDGETDINTDAFVEHASVLQHIQWCDNNNSTSFGQHARNVVRCHF